MSKKYKSLDKSAVQKSAEGLMEKNDTTTTLEVKKALRAGGYFAEQHKVSNFMLELSSELDWPYTTNGMHNSYTLSDPSDPSASTASSSNSSGSTASADVINIIEDLFAIHKYAMSDKSRIGKDLGLDTLQIADLKLECERKHGVVISMGEDTTIGEIQKLIDGSTPTSSKSSSNGKGTRIDIDPIKDFGHPANHVGVTNPEIQDMIHAGLIDDNDWILSLGSTGTRMIYAGGESRDHVRTAYARKIGSRIQDTRTRRAKNVTR